MINSKWKSSINNSRSFPSADIGSDHQLVIANLRLRFKVRGKPKFLKRYDVFKLKEADVRSNYEIEIGGRFGPLVDDENTDVENLWEGIKSAYSETSTKLLGNRKSQPQDPWISEEVLQLSDQRKRVKQEKLSDPTKRAHYNFLNREIKRKTKGCKDRWIQDLCKKS